MRTWLTYGALFAGLLAPLAAETMPSKPAGYFNDYAGVVDRPTALQLNEELAQFERDTSNQIVVAIYPNMQSESSVADYTQRIAQTWGVGGKKHNNGAVLFVFAQDHQMFLQSGYGTEGPLPDATAFDITHNLIAPYFRKNDYTGGLKAGIAAIMQAVAHEYKGTGKTQKEGEGNNGGGIPIGLIIFVVIVILIIASRRNTTRGYGYSGSGGPFIGGFGGGGWSGGSSGGGGSGFSGFSGGGGSFGGGGAGSSW